MQHCGCVTITTPQQKFSQLSVKKNNPKPNKNKNKIETCLNLFEAKDFPFC